MSRNSGFGTYAGDLARTGSAHLAPTPGSALRAKLLRTAAAYGQRAQDSDPGRLPSGAPAPTWMREAHQGTVMAALYGHALAAVLEVAALLPADQAQALHDAAQLVLENGPDDDGSTDDEGPVGRPS